MNQQRAEDLAEKLKNAEKENKELAQQLEELETQGTGGDRKVLNDLKIKVGEVALRGPGVVVTVNDSQVTPKAGENPNLYVIHDDDLLRLLNELRAAGAEALAINKERLLDVSEVRCAGPTVSVNNTRFTPPYEIRGHRGPQDPGKRPAAPGGSGGDPEVLGDHCGCEADGQGGDPRLQGDPPF